MKKRLFCVLLGLLVGFSLPLSVFAIDDTVSTEPMDEVLSLDDMLQVTTSIEDAFAVGYNIQTQTTTYYALNTAALSSFDPEDFSLSGWFPEQAEQFNDNNNNSGREIIPDEGEDDDRVQVSNTRNFPYSAIAYMEMIYADGEPCAATAFMISENVAMTAAHNLFKQNSPVQSAQWATTVNIWPGRNGDSIFTGRPFGQAQAIEVVISKQFRFEHEVAHIDGDTITYEPSVLSCYYDWGFIRLNKNIGEDCGYFGFEFGTSVGSHIYINGYWEDDNKQWLGSGYIINVRGGLDPTYIMHYDVDVTDGQSGGPVYRETNAGEFLVIAVHNTDYDGSGGNYGPTNQGSRITNQLYAFILSYTAMWQ